MDLEISERLSDGVLVLELSGSVTMGEAAHQLRARLKETLGNGNTQLVLDLSKLSYIDSEGLGALVAGYTTARNLGGNMKLANPTGQFRGQLNMTRLVTVFDVYDTVEEAVKSFGQSL